MPFSPILFLLFSLVLGALLALVQVGVITATFAKLGLSSSAALFLLFCSLLGSAFNLPLFTIAAAPPPPVVFPVLRRVLRAPSLPFTGRTLIALNVGGGLIPAVFSLYLVNHSSLGLAQVAVAIAMVATVSHLLSRPIPGLGIAMPIFVAPVTAALAALMLGPEDRAALAYISGTLGVLIGADLMRLGDVRRLGTPMASIGGAGTFDGIFITGLVAVLLS